MENSKTGSITEKEKQNQEDEKAKREGFTSQKRLTVKT